MSDFYVIKPAGEFSEHDLCVEASNIAGKNETCIHADFVDAFGGKSWNHWSKILVPVFLGNWGVTY